MQVPQNLDDARVRMQCHNQAVADFDLQLQMIDLELKMCTDEEGVLPYQEKKVDELEERKLKLLGGKRFHANASSCYWYYLAKEKN